MTFAIVVSEWNSEVTTKLLDGAISTLIKSGCSPENITVKWVPGTFELPLAAQYFIELTTVDAIITLGCVIQGETKHFDFICQSTAQSLQNIAIREAVPVIFGILTTNDMQQALDRAGGKQGNKGDEAAATAVKMVALARELESENFDLTKTTSLN